VNVEVEAANSGFKTDRGIPGSPPSYESIFMKSIAFRYLTAVACGILNFCVLFLSSSHGAADATDWTLGPFTRPVDAQPIIKPDPEAVFNCPMRQDAGPLGGDPYL